jgi:DNA-binding response OmpR family regulator
MEILVAEDDLVSRRALEASLGKWGHPVLVVGDGAAAYDVLSRDTAPRLAILDWMMPGLDGPTVCRRVRADAGRPTPYLILLTARGATEDRVAGLEAGADDYICKPFDRAELRARINVGLRMLALQRSLADRVTELEQALKSVRQLQGLLPICSYCKRIRSDGNYWQRVEEYISAHSDAQFSHGICPGCFESVVKKQIEAHREAHRDQA